MAKTRCADSPSKSRSHRGRPIPRRIQTQFEERRQATDTTLGPTEARQSNRRSAMRKETESEPPSYSSVFMIGQDSHNNWVVRDQSGLRGGLFVGRAEALRYVRDEAGNHPQAIVMVNGDFELGTSGMRRPPRLHQLSVEERQAHRVA